MKHTPFAQVIWVALLPIFWSQGVLAQGVQRMRLSGGTHIIRPSGGHVVKLPATCVDDGIPAPKYSHSMDLASSSSVKVSRKTSSGQLEGPFSLSEVNGPESPRRWFNITGNSSDTSLDLNCLTDADAHYDYIFSVDTSKPAVFGERTSETAARQGQNADSRSADDYVRALSGDPRFTLLQAVDTVDTALREVTQGNLEVQEAFLHSKTAGGSSFFSIEHHWNNTDLDEMEGAVMEFVGDQIRRLMFLDAAAADRLKESLGPKFSDIFPDDATRSEIIAAGDLYRTTVEGLKQSSDSPTVLNLLKEFQTAAWQGDIIQFTSEEQTLALRLAANAAYYNDPASLNLIESALQNARLNSTEILTPLKNADERGLRTAVEFAKSRLDGLRTLKNPILHASLASLDQQLRNIVINSIEIEIEQVTGALRSQIRSALLEDPDLVTEVENLYDAHQWAFDEVTGSWSRDEMRFHLRNVQDEPRALKTLSADENFQREIDDYGTVLKRGFIGDLPFFVNLQPREFLIRNAAWNSPDILPRAFALYSSQGWDVKGLVGTAISADDFQRELQLHKQRLGDLQGIQGGEIYEDLLTGIAEDGRVQFVNEGILPDLTTGDSVPRLLRCAMVDSPEILPLADAVLTRWGATFPEIPTPGTQREKHLQELSLAKQDLDSLSDAFEDEDFFGRDGYGYSIFLNAFALTGDVATARDEMFQAVIPAPCLAMRDPLTAARLLPGEFESSILSVDTPITDRQRSLLSSMGHLPEIQDSPFQKYALLNDDFFLSLKTEAGSLPLSDDTPAADIQLHLGQRTIVLPPSVGSLDEIGLTKARFGVDSEPIRFDAFIRTLKSDGFRSSIKTDGSATQPALVENRHVNAIPGRETHVRMIRMPASENKLPVGDAIVIKTSENRILLVDTGNGKAGLVRILENIRSMRPGQKTQVDVLITHDHADHVNGFKEILKSLANPDGDSTEGLVIGQVIFGVHSKDAPAVRSILENLDALFHKDPISSDHLFVYSHKSPEALSHQPMRLRVQEDDGNVQVLALDGPSSERIQIIRLTAPQSTNGSSLLLRVTRRGVSHLLAGDIDFKSMKVLVNSGIDLQADILKYPHHVSFPESMTQGDKENLAEFLHTVSPQRIQFSNYGSRQTEATERNLRQFCKDTLGYDVEFDSTNDTDIGGRKVDGVIRDSIVDVDAPLWEVASEVEITFIVGDSFSILR